MSPSTPGIGLYRAALACYLGLFAFLLAWLVWIAPPPAALRTPMLLLLGLPLLLGLRGVLHRRRYTLQWTSMLSLVYFMHGVVASAGPAPERWLGAAETLLALGYFGCALLYLRVSGRALAADRKRAEPAPAPRAQKER